MNPTHFFAASDPENADACNPHGDVFGYAAYVYAEDERGRRFRMNDQVANAYFDALHYGIKLSIVTFTEGKLFHRTNGRWVQK